MIAEEAFSTPEEVVAKIQATPLNPRSIRPGQGSLAEALHSAPEDPNFDLATWEREWAEVEAEIKAMARAPLD